MCVCVCVCVSWGRGGDSVGGMELRAGSNMILFLYILLLLIWHMYCFGVCILYIVSCHNYMYLWNLENVGECCKVQWVCVHQRIALHKSYLLLLFCHIITDTETVLSSFWHTLYFQSFQDNSLLIAKTSAHFRHFGDSVAFSSLQIWYHFVQNVFQVYMCWFFFLSAVTTFPVPGRL